MPKPVSTRQADGSVGPFAVVTMNMPTVMTTRQASTVGRRPILSAKAPKVIEPMAMPISSMERMNPRFFRLTCHSAAMPGDANEIDRTSNPSNAFSPMVIATATICSVLIGAADSVARGSVLAVVTK